MTDRFTVLRCAYPGGDGKSPVPRSSIQTERHNTHAGPDSKHINYSDFIYAREHKGRMSSQTVIYLQSMLWQSRIT